MYESRFGISGPPFQLSPDPSFYFDSSGHHAALAELRRGLDSETGFVVVSGEIGAGKTTLVRTLLEESDPSLAAVAHVVSTQLDAPELLRAILIALGIPSHDGSHTELRSALHRFLVKLNKELRRAVLIIDEAQNLHPDAFDELVVLVGNPSVRRAPVQVCLVGQPELRTMLESKELRAVRQLVGVSCHLGPIDRAETGAYIEHRLRKVGWSGTPSFAPGAFDEIYRWTHGIPRRINLLSNRLFLSMFLASKAEIDSATVAQTARDLRAEIGEPEAAPPAAAQAPLGQIPLVRDEVRPGTGGAFVARAAWPAMDPGPLLCVVAGAADHIKAAALMRALAARPELPAAKLVRAHPNNALQVARVLFDGRTLGDSTIDLDVAEDGDAEPVGRLSKRFESLVEHSRPKAVIAFDGSSAALACGLVAVRKRVALVHVGAGVRARDGLAAEHLTGKLTDDLADLLYTAEVDASEGLRLEGVPGESICCVGNLLADALQIALGSLLASPAQRDEPAVPEQILADRHGYALVVLNRPVNLSDRQCLLELVSVLRDVSRDVPLVWPMRAMVGRQLRKFRLDTFVAADRIVCLPEQAYPQFAGLLHGATCVLTDSWNVQDEATVLGIPCLTLGLHPDRTTSMAHSSIPVGKSRTLATRAVWECIFNGGRRGRAPDLWDGRTAARIADHLSTWLAASRGYRFGP